MSEYRATSVIESDSGGGANKEVYHRLRQRIDELSVPYPATESGAELRLLRALFDEREAAVALSMSGIPEPVDVIHRRVGDIDRKELAGLLNGLARKGAINAGVTRVGGKRVLTYGLLPLVVGMFEYQVDKLTPEYVRDFHEYIEGGFRDSMVGEGVGQLRTVPVRADLAAERTVAPYNDIRAYVRDHSGPFSVINCVCRQGAEITGRPCTTSSSHETCLMLGHVPSGARKLTKEEFLEIFDRAEREGHVLQPQNTRNPAYICCCCKDCCELLENARKLPRPADAIPGAYRAEVNQALCTGCRKCERRCPMDAVIVNDKLAAVEADRCIGCGLCATACPEHAIALRKRARTRRPAKNTVWMHVRLYIKRRGILGVVPLAVRKLLGLRI